jgi:hypothetical protein
VRRRSPTKTRLEPAGRPCSPPPCQPSAAGPAPTSTRAPSLPCCPTTNPPAVGASLS